VNNFNVHGCEFSYRELQSQIPIHLLIRMLKLYVNMCEGICVFMNEQNGLVIVCNPAVVNNKEFYVIADRAGECGNESLDSVQCGEFLD